MKFFNWMQNKLNGAQGNKRPNAVPSKNHVKEEPSKEEFSDWPDNFLAIGTFGNADLREQQEIHIARNQEKEIPQEEECFYADFSEFTAEEVRNLQKELTKLLSRKPVSKAEEQIADLPLDRFLNCPSSLEVDRAISDRFLNCPSNLEVDRTASDRFSTVSDEKDEEEIDRTIRIILGRCKDVCEKKKKKAIGKKSLTFLFKKMFVCSSGFGPSPNLRDSLQESRMEKLLRTILSKTMRQQNSSGASSRNKYLEDSRPKLKAETEEESQDKTQEGSKWIKNDSDFIVLEI